MRCFTVRYLEVQTKNNDRWVQFVYLRVRLCVCICAVGTIIIYEAFFSKAFSVGWQKSKAQFQIFSVCW